jgi:hypothetical protein
MADAISPDNFPVAPTPVSRPLSAPADPGSANGGTSAPANPGSSAGRAQAIPASHGTFSPPR